MVAMDIRQTSAGEFAFLKPVKFPKFLAFIQRVEFAFLKPIQQPFIIAKL